MNAFLQHADAFARKPRPARSRKPASTVEELKQQKEDDAANELRRRAAAWERSEIEAAGRDDVRILALDKRLRRGLQPGDEDECLRLAEQFVGASRAVRFVAQNLIDSAIIRLRQRLGLPAFDDPLPGEPDNVFLTIREMLR